ncbi:unnamed protein product [Gongylonema pulchrum]|uniref:Transmembrane protein n=1 Tax=Gongylonema pulchrum TaxID=637853 RepID=A0A183CUZ6_9BILA|nr:unnamed protein product [Gongylonema pulchrum]
MDHVEGSGNNNNMMGWSDDEDLGSEGSGVPEMEGSGDTEGIHDAIVPVVTAEDVRQTERTVLDSTTSTSTFTEQRLETRPPTRPPVIAKPPAAGSTDRSSLSILTAFVILWAPLLFY